MTDRRPLRRLRVLAGFVVAPFVATAIALVAYQTFFNSGLFPSGGSIRSIDNAASLGSGVGILAVLVTMFVAAPSVLVLREHHRLSFLRLLLLGAVAGNVPLALIVGGILLTQIAGGKSVVEASRLWEGLSGLLVRVAMGLVCGTGAAAAFWTVAFAGVERDSENT